MALALTREYIHGNEARKADLVQQTVPIVQAVGERFRQFLGPFSTVFRNVYDATYGLRQ